MPFVDGFLPSQQPYIYHWYFIVALPTILNLDALKKTQILITDQCLFMSPALDKETDDEEIVEETYDDEEVCCFVRNVIETLRTGGDAILLAVAWTTNDGYVSYMRFLYVLGTDMTFGDNNEKRPHIRSIGKNARNKNLPFVDGFLPSQQPYIYHWYFSVALPTILNPDALKKAQILITDQCLFTSPALDSVLQH